MFNSQGLTDLSSLMPVLCSHSSYTGDRPSFLSVSQWQFDMRRCTAFLLTAQRSTMIVGMESKDLQTWPLRRKRWSLRSIFVVYSSNKLTLETDGGRVESRAVQKSHLVSCPHRGCCCRLRRLLKDSTWHLLTPQDCVRPPTDTSGPSRPN